MQKKTLLVNWANIKLWNQFMIPQFYYIILKFLQELDIPPLLCYHRETNTCYWKKTLREILNLVCEQTKLFCWANNRFFEFLRVVKNVPKEPSQHFNICHRFANLDQQHPFLKVYKQTKQIVQGRRSREKLYGKSHNEFDTPYF